MDKKNGGHTLTLDFYRPHRRVYAPTKIRDRATGKMVDPMPRTKQEFKAECDINSIIKLYKQTGQITHIKQAAAQGAYADLPEPLDFQQSLNLVMEAEASFMTLPSKVRDRFGNDPAQFLGFMADPANFEEIINLGLATRRPSETGNSPDASASGGNGKPPNKPPAAASAPAAPPPPPKPENAS